MGHNSSTPKKYHESPILPFPFYPGILAGNKEPCGPEEHSRVCALAASVEEGVLGLDLKQWWKEHLLDCLSDIPFLRIDPAQLQVGVAKIIHYVPAFWESL